MQNIISLIQGNTEDLSRLITILSLALITFFGLFCWSLFRAHKLEKEIARLKSHSKS